LNDGDGDAQVLVAWTAAVAVRVFSRPSFTVVPISLHKLKDKLPIATPAVIATAENHPSVGPSVDRFGDWRTNSPSFIHGSYFLDPPISGLGLAEPFGVRSRQLPLWNGGSDTLDWRSK
jgi:hypothetical protein